MPPCWDKLPALHKCCGIWGSLKVCSIIISILGIASCVLKFTYDDIWSQKAAFLIYVKCIMIMWDFFFSAACIMLLVGIIKNIEHYILIWLYLSVVDIILQFIYCLLKFHYGPFLFFSFKAGAKTKTMSYGRGTLLIPLAWIYFLFVVHSYRKRTFIIDAATDE